MLQNSLLKKSLKHLGLILVKLENTLTLFTQTEFIFTVKPVAVTIAQTLEQAELAASLIKIEYQKEEASLSIKQAIENNQLVPFPDRPDKTRGNPESVLSNAQVSIDANYIVTAEHHNPIELHATIAVWEKERLTVYDKTQWVTSVQQQLSSAFRYSPKRCKCNIPLCWWGFW